MDCTRFLNRAPLPAPSALLLAACGHLFRTPSAAERRIGASERPAGSFQSALIITEVDPMRALEAVMDGFEVLPMERAAEIADIFFTATGDKGSSPGAPRAHQGRRHRLQHRALQCRDRDPGAA